MTRIETIRAELDAGHPTTGPYSADDKTAADEMNAINRPGDTAGEDLNSYWLSTRNDGLILQGRLEIIASQTEGENDRLGEGIVLTLEHITSAISMMEVLKLSAYAGYGIDLTTPAASDMLDNLAGGVGCRILTPGQKDEIQALSVGKQSRGQEIGVGRVWKVDIQEARAL